VSKVLRSGVITDPRERRGNGIEPAAVTTQHNPTCAIEPRGDAAAANDHSRAPRARGAGALSLDTMDEYAAELAEVGRLLRDGAFRAGAVMNSQADTGAISSTIVSIPLASCRSHNEKNRRVSHD
jgi:hypothetical protein